MLIIALGAKNIDHEKTNRSDSESICSTVYICRSCPTFRTLAKESVGNHLSEVHHISVKQLPGQLSGMDCRSSSVEVSQVPAPLCSSVENPWSTNSPPPRPHSPVSPLTKENCRPRKKITVTLNASPTLTLASSPSVEITQSTRGSSSHHDKNAEERIKTCNQLLYECPFCDKRFSHTNALESHKIGQHKDSNMSCSTLGK
ncbi:hypothetical protein FGIG_07839 [Fasciola gigantica]|uniref:C2H2-type domain-containing protein n=1 Tax=Fasciola gigantica TaxID=46835 RepID=A0A504Z3S0_FASGI|nr:hypothetical protein FGIG_07839 [Fasciola gigantica]